MCMFRWLFGEKKEAQQVREETRKAFDAVRKDIDHVGKWIKHLHNKDSDHHERISSADVRLSTIEKEISELKMLVALLNEDLGGRIFPQPSTAVYKQRAVEAVEKPVETAVYAGVDASFLGFSVSPLVSLTAMERAVVYVLLTSELKLSYEDLAVMLGKDRSTLRSQINMIRKKSPELIEEYVEKNGKKRVFIPEEVRKKLLKNTKLRGIKRISKKGEEEYEEK